MQFIDMPSCPSLAGNLLGNLFALPNPLRQVGDQLFLLISRHNGKRRILFLPWLVIKLAKGRHRRALSKEARNAARARRNPFWADSAIRVRRLGPFGILSRRQLRVRPTDHQALAADIEERLCRAMKFPRRSAAILIGENQILAELAPRERARLLERLSKLALPHTGMHGDFHLGNIARSRKGAFVLLDWEHYDPDGSFVFDAIEFHVADQVFASGDSWLSFLGNFEPRTPTLIRLAKLLDTTPDVLWTFYLITKLNIIARRKGGFERLPRERQQSILDLVGSWLQTRQESRQVSTLGR